MIRCAGLSSTATCFLALSAKLSFVLDLLLARDRCTFSARVLVVSHFGPSTLHFLKTCQSSELRPKLTKCQLVSDLCSKR